MELSRPLFHQSIPATYKDFSICCRTFDITKPGPSSLFTRTTFNGSLCGKLPVGDRGLGIVALSHIHHFSAKLGDKSTAKNSKIMPFAFELFQGCRVASVSGRKFPSWVCFSAGGKRSRKPPTWNTHFRKGSVSKSEKLVKLVKSLSNVKEEVYGALDSFVAWQVEFPLFSIKKALRRLEWEKEWSRVIQICKWMLDKGQGKSYGTYYVLLNAFAEEERIEEAEELWNMLLFRYQEFLPRKFFTRMIAMYKKQNMIDKLLETFADMEELGVKPEHSTVLIVADVFKDLGIMEKHDKVLEKYPETEYQMRYNKGKPYKVLVPKSQRQEEISKGNDGSSIAPSENIRVKEEVVW